MKLRNKSHCFGTEETLKPGAGPFSLRGPNFCTSTACISMTMSGEVKYPGYLIHSMISKSLWTCFEPDLSLLLYSTNYKTVQTVPRRYLRIPNCEWDSTC